MKITKSQVFYALYCCFGKHLPPSFCWKPAKWIRVFFARRVLASCGREVNIERGAVFSGRVSLGNGSGIGVDCRLYGPVWIGDDVMMGPEVIIYTRNHVSTRTDIPMRRQGYEEAQPVAIGDDVWIGSRVTILPGVEIGKGCILGAGAVVTKSTEPYAVVAGNPARLIRYRGASAERPTEPQRVQATEAVPT